MSTLCTNIAQSAAASQDATWKGGENHSLKFGLVRRLILLLMQTFQWLWGWAYRVCSELKTLRAVSYALAYRGKLSDTFFEQSRDYGIKTLLKRERSPGACCSVCVCVVVCVCCGVCLQIFGVSQASGEEGVELGISKTGSECKLLYFSLINIDSTKGQQCIASHGWGVGVEKKNTTWINFTISQFSVLIKKQQSPLKRSIPTKEAARREFPCRLALSIQRRHKRMPPPPLHLPLVAGDTRGGVK